MTSVIIPWGQRCCESGLSVLVEGLVMFWLNVFGLYPKCCVFFGGSELTCCSVFCLVDFLVVFLRV